MTHPFHPLYGQEFELVTSRHNWGEERVFYYDPDGNLVSIPASWTSAAAPDPFVTLAAGRSLFRFKDLVDLTALLQNVKEHLPVLGEVSVKEEM